MACFGLRKKSKPKIEGYELKREIGVGGFGVVLLARNKSDKIAVKVTHVGWMIDTREIPVALLYLKHPHVIKQYKTILTRGYLIDIMECSSEMDLGGYKVTDRKEAKMIFQQIISAVDYCHRKMVVHRDIKPANILIDKNQRIKLVDFGLATVMLDGKYLSGLCCTERYRPPEVTEEKPYIGPEVDVYSCGVTFTELWLRGAAKECGIAYTLRCEETLLLHPVIRERFRNDPAMELMYSMRIDNPLERATMDDIKKHPWFKQDIPDYMFPRKWTDQLDWVNIIALDEVRKKFDVSIDDAYNLITKQTSLSLCCDYCLTIDNWRCDKQLAERPITWEFRIGPPKKYNDIPPIISQCWDDRSGHSKQEDYKKQDVAANEINIEDKQMVFHRGLKFDYMKDIIDILEILYSSFQALDLLKMIFQLYRTGRRVYPYVVVIQSLSYCDSTDKSSVTNYYHSTMSFLEVCSLFFCKFYHQNDDEDASMDDDED